MMKRKIKRKANERNSILTKKFVLNELELQTKRCTDSDCILVFTMEISFSSLQRDIKCNGKLNAAFYTLDIENYAIKLYVEMYVLHAE